jgi:acyl-CoA reductase-like NAD-dependent aldehyde dehydrogenase
MRNAIIKLPTQRSIGERRQVLRAAVRQLDRAETYLAAITYMDLGDPSVERATSRLRADLDGIRRYLVEQRDRTHS